MPLPSNFIHTFFFNLPTQKLAARSLILCKKKQIICTVLYLEAICLALVTSLCSCVLMSRVSVSPSWRGKSFSRSIRSGFLFKPWSIHSRAFIEGLLDGVNGYKSRWIMPVCCECKKQCTVFIAGHWELTCTFEKNYLKLFHSTRKS